MVLTVVQEPPTGSSALKRLFRIISELHAITARRSPPTPHESGWGSFSQRTNANLIITVCILPHGLD